MSLLDLITRAEFIFKKYEKYTKAENRDKLLTATDAFGEGINDFMLQLSLIKERAAEAAKERNRTTLAQINAEIRREKQKLKAQVPDLYKLAKKKARKLPPEEKEKRKEKIAAIEDELDAIADGTAHERKKREKLIGASGPITLNVDVSTMQLQPMSMDHSKESEGFALEFKASKAKQDEGLEVISKGLRTLKDLGHSMADELKKQDPLLNVIDDKATDATAELRTSNVKLKKLLAEMRSPHKICLDLILVSVLLGIGSYIFTMVKPGGTASKVVAAAKCNDIIKGGCSPPPAPSSRRLLASAWGPDWGGGGVGAGGGVNDVQVLRLLR